MHLVHYRDNDEIAQISCSRSQLKFLTKYEFFSTDYSKLYLMRIIYDIYLRN